MHYVTSIKLQVTYSVIWEFKSRFPLQWQNYSSETYNYNSHYINVEMIELSPLKSQVRWDMLYHICLESDLGRICWQKTPLVKDLSKIYKELLKLNNKK